MTKEEMAVELIIRLEGYKSDAYEDSKGIWTIGIGTTVYPDGEQVKPGDYCSFEIAKEYLDDYLKRFVYPQVESISSDMPDTVFAALCSLVYNCGEAARNKNIKEAVTIKNWKLLTNTIFKYTKIHVKNEYKLCPGLVNRRLKEIAYMQSGLLLKK